MTYFGSGSATDTGESTSTPHLALPLRIENGRAAEVEQDSPEHVADRLIAAARTPLGLRDDDPEFGVPEGTFRAGGADLEALRAALAESEPEATFAVDRITGEDDLLRDRLALLITGGEEVD